MTTITSLRLLLIDDDELDRQAITRMLKHNSVNYNIVHASTAADGLKIAAGQHFDAILLDYLLPDQDGLEVLNRLRSNWFEGVAVIVLTGQEDDGLAERCLEAGAQDFLLKSEVNARRLTRAVQQARQRYLMENALKISRDQLRQLAERDPLTGLVNRRGFEMALETALSGAQRRQSGVGVLLLDLDDFKIVNDTLGHDAGDQLLTAIAQRLRTTVRNNDLLCRLGGDEFVVLMLDLEKAEQAALLADRIVDSLRHPIHIDGAELIVTTSVGIAVLDDCAESAIELLKFADLAMYQAKQDGRNKRRFYSAALQEAAQFRATMKRDLEQAVKKKEFQIYYQAQIKATDGGLGGVEALLRWHHPRLGTLAPSAFMSVAEETGLIVSIGDWVLNEACKQFKQWQQRILPSCPDLTIAVNLSAIQIKPGTFLNSLENALAANQLDARYLELELIESALFEDVEGLVSLLTALSGQGVTLSLDDFGTGYSSLQHLKLFPISAMKIDRGFVSTIGTGGKNDGLLMAIIAFAKTLEMKVVAEGVETKEQASFCIKNGCDLLQGYYYSRPVPAEEFEMAFLPH